MSYTNKELVDLAREYPLPYLSYSQITSYRKCPWTYKLTYLSGDFKSTGNKFTKLGNVFHDIAEWQGRQNISENPLELEALIKSFNVNFTNVLKEHKDYFESKDDFIKLYKKGIQAIKNYYSVYHDETPLFVEKNYKGKVAEGLPPIKSFIDRIDGDKDDPSSWIITDYKTGSQPKAKAYLKDDLQLGLYAAQVYATTGYFPKAVQFYHPVPDKFQTAIHQGDGHYKFTGQRDPVVEFSVSDIIIEVRETVADIVMDIKNDSFKRVVEKWSCKNCFHNISGDCKPFEKAEGWDLI